MSMPCGIRISVDVCRVSEEASSLEVWVQNDWEEVKVENSKVDRDQLVRDWDGFVNVDRLLLLGWSCQLG